jgi:prepilin-type N-terminal cleavage/methylation domain-containing protein
MILSPIRRSNKNSFASCRGFTLVEVMIGMILTTILVMGMSGVWGMVSEQFFQLALRQKAVFVLHGQMERLASLYRYTNFIEDTTIHPDLANLEDIIHQTGSGNDESNAYISGLVYLETTDTDVDKDDFIQGQTLFMDYSSGTKINVVWLDRDLDITATMKWSLTPISTACYQETGNADHSNCYLLTLTLEYPYRFIENTNPVKNSMGTLETLTLQTITGRR